jgi:hypothetical protein
MGRSDEPQLEELAKLLRRLETMEVAPKHESNHKPEPEKPQAEYVGALRGAAPARAPEERRGEAAPGKGLSPYRALEPQARPDTGARFAGTTAVVIGATTAALVSSVVAVSLLTLTSGGPKDEGERRLTFYAPAAPSASPASNAAPSSPARHAAVTAPAPADVQPLLQRADDYLRNGKPDEARVVLEQAAQAGSGVAALTLGAMYDPGRVAQFTNLALKADPNVARVWYERARNLGVAEANERLAELSAK